MLLTLIVSSSFKEYVAKVSVQPFSKYVGIEACLYQTPRYLSISTYATVSGGYFSVVNYFLSLALVHSDSDSESFSCFLVLTLMHNKANIVIASKIKDLLIFI